MLQCGHYKTFSGTKATQEKTFLILMKTINIKLKGIHWRVFFSRTKGQTKQNKKHRIEMRAGATFDWLFFNNSKLTDFDD